MSKEVLFHGHRAVQVLHVDLAIGDIDEEHRRSGYPDILAASNCSRFPEDPLLGELCVERRVSVFFGKPLLHDDLPAQELIYVHFCLGSLCAEYLPRHRPSGRLQIYKYTHNRHLCAIFFLHALHPPPSSRSSQEVMAGRLVVRAALRTRDAVWTEAVIRVAVRHASDKKKDFGLTTAFSDEGGGMLHYIRHRGSLKRVNAPLKQPPRSVHMVPFDLPNPSLAPENQEPFKWSFYDTSTKPPKDAPDVATCDQRRLDSIRKLRRDQKMLAASPYSVLLIFQAMDAGGKDSCIRKVLSGVNPAGCQVYGFKQPSAQEMEHDWLHRTRKLFPERGRIGVFNRSYYEETLVVRVHPNYLRSYGLTGLYEDAQFSDPVSPHILWEDRFDSVRHMELHAARNNTVILKFMLHVSKQEQAARLLNRINVPSRNWKFSHSDLSERAVWGHYMKAYGELLPETSRPWAPWYVVPADNKPYCQMVVADIIQRAVEGLDLSFPKVSKLAVERLQSARTVIHADLDATTKAHAELRNFNHCEWKALKASQKEAAVLLGYSKATWNMSCSTIRPDPSLSADSAWGQEMAENIMSDKIRETPFHSLPVFKQLAAQELGYEPQTWNDPKFQLPIYEKSWNDIEPDTLRNACKNLGYNERTWNTRATAIREHENVINRKTKHNRVG
eukprot:m.142070 g.142070  ORF g.142070 m.142070 type:complete len:671 (-) comp14054_c0_seq8:223-2235(-)